MDNTNINPLDGAEDWCAVEDWAAVEGTDETIKIAWHERFEGRTILHYGGWTAYYQNPAGAWHIPAFYPVKETQ